MTTTFIVSDESVNSYGYVVLTSGINIQPFENNPVMFYMHNRESGIVGRWENIRKEGKQLLADAVFDDSTTLGQQVKTQVEKGFLRCASIGVENVVKEVLNGVETVIKCDLKEISIVDMPANNNAVKLYKKSGKCVYRLCDLADNHPDNLKTQITGLLGLDNTATDTEILEAIKSLLKPPGTVDAEIDNAIDCGYIENSQRTNFRAMALANKQAFTAFVESKRKEQTPAIERLINDAAGKGKFLYQDRGVFENIGKRLGVTVLSQVIATLRDTVKPNDIIRSDNNRANWGLNDYRKFAPWELKDNPALYARLIEKEGAAAVDTDTLDYYRRNNPEYLRDNPEIYQRLTNLKH